eukprot:CAMPEP_0172718462 /NCGR_PEP_ID=MMETSP1074-20121228/74465_1 /TAXON_ID=2916 /ORGANISM="Ceratium fusus, Strain PA161109" /LENGTH=55 /DNA_ID=CAMNT_0013543669 /DNA_START=36 /DNA_END=200 /DNA_ORIENTATION=-
MAMAMERYILALGVAWMLESPPGPDTATAIATQRARCAAARCYEEPQKPGISQGW